MIVRRALHALGYRYRLHRKGLPGKPDIVFGPRKKAIFVHGCFWHRHSCKLGDRMPKSNLAFWTDKLEKNAARDKAVAEQLRALGWSVLVVWECEARPGPALNAKLKDFLDN
jgi:DNA mismatch endonuclease (patch repair protein)